METIKINGKLTDRAAILNRSFDWNPFSESEIKAVKVIRSWLTGQQEFCFQTSGSTGPPKQLCFSREQISRSATRTLEYFNLTAGSTAWCCLNTDFIAGFMMIIRALEGKLNLIITEPTADPWPTLHHEELVDFAAITPVQADSIQKYAPGYFYKMKNLLIGGAAIHPVLEQQLQGLPCKIYHSYSMTETLTHVAIRHVNGPTKAEVYRALKGVKFDFDTESRLIVQDDYLGLPALATNDMVELLNDETFRWMGRHDNTINSGGIKIQVETLEGQIQKVLADHGMQADIAIVAVPDRQLTQKMVMLMKSHKISMSHHVLLDLLKAELPKYHCPKEIVTVPEFLLTKTGKIDRISNAEKYIRL